MTAQLATVEHCNILQAGGWRNSFKDSAEKSDKRGKIPCFN